LFQISGESGFSSKIETALLILSGFGKESAFLKTIPGPCIGLPIIYTLTVDLDDNQNAS